MLPDNSMWCAYTPEWNNSYSTITYQTQNFYESNEIDEPMNLMTGIFQAKTSGYYTVTVTAVVGGMLPSKPGDILMEISPVYAQLYVKVNGKLMMNNEKGHLSYLIVKPNVVGELELTLHLSAGDTVQLQTGHVTSYKLSREAYNHRITSIPGGYLEDITFCLVNHEI
eukprot:TRINITY_DN13088_c0_g1_i3.p1 TRINITY_DN13088_c0_g1~~TRINITY_DN13088_c0_g1_i3.p1  ORF type:complete len:168 (-),score=33.98 TRINITY_DN13088_c0_g1_i3:136-639(-)